METDYVEMYAERDSCTEQCSVVLTEKDESQRKTYPEDKPKESSETIIDQSAAKQANIGHEPKDSIKLESEDAMSVPLDEIYLQDHMTLAVLVEEQQRAQSELGKFPENIKVSK